MAVRALLLLVAGALGCASAVESSTADPNRDDEESIADDTLSLTPATGPLRFSRACRSGERVTLAAVGDVMPHVALQQQAYDHGWSSLWSRMPKWLDDASITVGNQEGPAARGIAEDGSLVADPGPVFDGWVYTGRPFNMHRSVELALKNASFDLVTTANNHALDRGSLGIDRTLDAMDAVGLAHVGTIRASSTGPWSRAVYRNGLQVRFVACTYGTNGIADRSDQVLRCDLEKDRLISTVRSLHARSDVDAIVVLPHFGRQYTNTPDDAQRDLAHDLLDAGASAVLGSHPHVLQPWEKYVTRDGRETFILYSLGNFVSRHEYLTLARRTSILLYLGLTRGSDGKTFVNGVRYMPIYTRYTDGKWNVAPIDEVGGYSDARRLATTMYGEWNVRRPGQVLDTTPECE